MEAWRNTGYVPDSDDDDEYESQETTNADVLPIVHGDQLQLQGSYSVGLSVGSDNNGTKIETDRQSSHSLELGSTAQSTQLAPEDVKDVEDIGDNEVSSEDELQVVGFWPTKELSSHRFAETKPDQHGLVIDDDDDSSLSSLSSPPSSPDPFESAERPTKVPDDQYSQYSQLQQSDMMDVDKSAEENAASQKSVDADLLPPVDIPPEILHEATQEPVRRSLRQRLPIQLHPYLLEDAKHRGQFMSSGIKPVRYYPAEHHHVNHQQESQESDLNIPELPSSSQASEFNHPPSSPDPYRSPRSARRHRTPTQLSQPTSDQDQPHTQKRRKLFHSGQEKPRTKQFSALQVVVSQANTPLSGRNKIPIDIPPSPPRSGSLSSSVTARCQDGFRFPRGFSPPLKATSSVTNHPVSTEDNDSSLRGEVEMEIDTPDGNVVELSTNNEDSEEDEANAPEKEDSQVKKLQQKIRGVLPASWLRLDLRNQGEKTNNSSLEKRHLDPHGTQYGPAKGVARKVFRARGATVHSPTPHPVHEIFSDSSDSGDNAEVHDDRRETTAVLVEPDDDIPEDNRLDDVFPPVPRPLKTQDGPNRSRLRQSKTPKNGHIRFQNQTSKPRVPKLGVLDAPDVARQSRKEQPQFLRVAARQARSRRDQGRSSPHKKFFRMPTQDETEDTHRVLRDWKTGTIRQTKLPVVKASRQSRPHLQSIVANMQTVRQNGLLANSSHASPNKDAPRQLSMSSSMQENENLGETAVTVPKQHGVASCKKPRPRNVKVIPRSFAIQSLKRTAVRPAESENIGFQESPSAAFSIPLATLNKAYRARPVTLHRFLATGQSSTQPQPVQYPSASQHRPKAKSLVKSNQRQLQFSKKRPPNRIDIETFDPSPHMVSVEPRQSNPIATVNNNAHVTLYGLQGIKDAGAFSVDFGIVPIRLGTYFHSSTFTGEGELSQSLDLEKKNLDQDLGFAMINFGEQIFRWGPWNEVVSSEIGTVIDTIIKENETQNLSRGFATEPEASRHLAAIIRYISGKLHFTDPIDRIPCIERIEFLVCKIKDHIATLELTDRSQWMSCLKLASLNIVLANQMQQIASHDLVDSTKHDMAIKLVQEVSRQLFPMIFMKHGLQNIHQFYESNKNAQLREAGIRDNFPAVEAYVIAFRVLCSSKHFRGTLEEIMLSLSNEKVDSTDIRPLEDTWKAFFTILPLNEFDEFGHARPGLRFRGSNRDNWPAIQPLVVKVLEAYELNSSRPAYYINYCRVVFQRCFLLIVAWGWRDCKIILQTLFGFYAKHMLYNLKTEGAFGSPSFLESLDSNPVIDIEGSDSCFHLFIKILGSGLRYLAQTHDVKVMKNLAWRLLPNHGRIYPKEKDLDPEDLDALRNHHDLLCTVYWAVPEGCRPRLAIIRNLVDPANSHLETCNLSIRSWRRLVHFKLSTNEKDNGLTDFADWYGSFTSELVRQHVLAKTEVEEQVKGHIEFSKKKVESTISHNQRQIEALLSSTITAMESAIQSSRSPEQACSLIKGVPFSKLLGLFDPVNPRVNPLINQTLQIILNLLAKAAPVIVTAAATTNDDSQEFGDWSAIEEAYDGISEDTKPNIAVQYLNDTIKPILSELLSNLFGQERSPEDRLLLKVTECWSYLAQTLVNNGLQYWNNYINSYSQLSWTTLRTTPQTKKFAPQFLASCLEKDRQFFTDCRAAILEIWISSLVDRTSMLKFQHHLTEVLLNGNEQLPLFKNLPFYRRGGENRYHITLAEFTDRRLSLISSLLSNMREHLEEFDNTASKSQLADEYRNEYRQLAMSLMSSMKSNYQELGQFGKVAQGQYVDFVHLIVGFMQEHSQAFCPLDRFFTDPACFPLPQRDPEYIVARFKSYGVRLPSGKAAKALVTFLQSVCEVAALDDKQETLISQLGTCMRDIYELGDKSKPTLRSFLFHVVFPVYIEESLSHAAAWILVVPIVKTISRAAHDLLYEIDINDQDCIASVNSMLGANFEAIQTIMSNFLDRPDYLRDSAGLIILQSLIEAAGSMLRVLDYIDRNDFNDAHNMSMLEILGKQTVFVLKLLTDSSDAHQQRPVVQEGAAGCQRHFVLSLFTETRAFAKRELRASLSANWSKHNTRYFIRRGKEAKEVNNDLVRTRGRMDLEASKGALVDTANGFLKRLALFDILKLSDVQGFLNVTKQSTIYDVLGDGIDELIL